MIGIWRLLAVGLVFGTLCVTTAQAAPIGLRPESPPVKPPRAQPPETTWVIWETDVPVQRLALDGDNLWAGAYKGGLFRWDLERGPQAYFRSEDGLPGMDVVSLAVDDAGAPRLWDDFARYWDEVNEVGGVRLVLEVGSPAQRTATGALFQLQFASSLEPQDIRRLSDMINGQQAADIIMNDVLQTIFETKSYNWSQFPPFLQQRTLDEFLKQLADHAARYPGSRQIVFVFNSEFGAVPDLIRNGLENAGGVVRIYP